MTTLVTVPGSKSLTNRALLLTALAQGTSTLKGALLSEDTRVMIEALKHLGVAIEENGTTLKINGTGTFQAPGAPLNLENAGTAVRFLTAILAHQPFESTLDGNERMRARPLGDLIEALKELGATIDCKTGCPPLTLSPGPLVGSKTHLSGRESSQYVSALLMLGPLLPHGLTLTIDHKLTSKPYVDLTIDLMKTFDVHVETIAHGYKVAAQTYQSKNIPIEADASSATYFFGMATLTGNPITVAHLTRHTLQPDIRILDALETMGSTVTETPVGLTVQGPPTLQALGTLNANAFPDGAMTLAVISAFAQGTTTLTGLHNLKLKESDRLQALATELQKIGDHVSITKPSIMIKGNPTALHSASIATYNDHRMAMCFGMAQSRLPDLTIQNPDCVAKTYPDFWKDLMALLKKITP